MNQRDFVFMRGHICGGEPHLTEALSPIKSSLGMKGRVSCGSKKELEARSWLRRRLISGKGLASPLHLEDLFGERLTRLLT